MNIAIYNMTIFIPSGEAVPKFGRVDIYGSLFRSKDRAVEFDASGVLFVGCTFDGPMPKNPRGCEGCIMTGWSSPFDGTGDEVNIEPAL